MNYKLSDILSIVGGGTPKTTNSSYWGGDIPWLSVVDFNNDNRYVSITEKFITQAGVENSSTKILPKGALILSARGTVGALAQLSKPMAFNQSCYGIVAKECTTNDFLYYLLKNIVHDLQAKGHGSVFNTITRDTFDTIEIELPPLDEQKRIAEFLGAFDDKIELLQKQNKTLEDMAKALFKSWFVDFDVVRAKQKGLPKADIMREYHLTDELYDLFPSSFADSSLGPIPSGWEVVKISDVARVVGGGTPSTKQTKFFSASGTAIAWLTPKDLSGYQYKYIDHGQTDITQEGLTHSSAQLMPTNSIVFSSRAPIGYIAISLGEIATNQGFKSLVPLERHWTEFLYQYLCYNRYIIEGLGTGSTFKEVSGSVMKNISLCFPSSEILKAFEQETEIINSKQKIIMKEIQTLTELRNTLLPRLISGKIRV